MADLQAGRRWDSRADHPQGEGPWTRPEGRPRTDYSGTQASQSDDLVERLAWLMDQSIQLPGGYRIGVDPIIGLIPGIGDVIGTAVSAAIVFQAHRMGIPKATLMRMVANVGIDAALGAIPFIGDAFDFVFKANAKNLELYRQARGGIGQPSEDRRHLARISVWKGRSTRPSERDEGPVRRPRGRGCVQDEAALVAPVGAHHPDVALESARVRDPGATW